jgi:hypothetical protein
MLMAITYKGGANRAMQTTTTASISGIPAEVTATATPGLHVRVKDAVKLFTVPMEPPSATVHKLLTCFDNTTLPV